MLKTYKFPTILGLAFLLLAIGASVFLVQQRQSGESDASEEIKPEEVRITNISEKSFSVSWTTTKPSNGFISYGKSSSLGQMLVDDKVSNLHHLTITGLDPDSTYFFKVGSGKVLYGSGKSPYQTKTAIKLTNTPNNDVIFGTIADQQGNPTSSIIYVTVNGVSPLSTVSDNEGKWSIPLSTARTTNLSGFATYSENTLIEVLYQKENNQTATAKIIAGAAHPVPLVKIGENKDFTNLKPTSGTNLPTSEVTLPQGEINQSSGFNLQANDQPAQKTTVVTVTYPKDKEKINTNKPEFIGAGTAGTKISLKLEAPKILTTTVTIDTKGSWKWTAPSALDTGDRTLTLSWKDASGNNKSLTRTFTVLGDSDSTTPSFTASGSAVIASPTPVATVSPTPIIKTSPSPSPKASPKASPTPKPSPSKVSASESATPIAGELTPTVAIFIMGFVLVLTGILIPKTKFF